jgi:hypothetical protein
MADILKIVTDNLSFSLDQDRVLPVSITDTLSLTHNTVNDEGSYDVTDNVAFSNAPGFEASFKIIHCTINVAIPPTLDIDLSIHVHQSDDEDVPLSIKLIDTGYGDVPLSAFVISYKDIPCDIDVKVYGYEDVPCSISVLDNFDIPLDCTVVLFVDVPISIGVMQSADKDVPISLRVAGLKDVALTINVPPYKDLPCLLSVSTTLQHVPLSITVNNYAYEDVPLSLLIVDQDIQCKINVQIEDDIDIDLTINVQIKDEIDVPLTIEVSPYKDTVCSIEIISNFDLPIEIAVLGHHPDDVVVSCDIDEDTWQSVKVANFTWLEPSDAFYAIDQYYVAWNTDPDHEVTIVDQRVSGLSIQKTAILDTKYYFHIRAKNTAGQFSAQTTHYGVWINNVPTAPTSLLIENTTLPVIYATTPIASWTNSTDTDQLDVLTYEISIGQEEDLSDATIISDITQAVSGSISDYELSLALVGRWYWKVRAFDTKQFGPWSTITHFDLEASTEDLALSITLTEKQKANIPLSIGVFPYETVPITVNVLTINNFDVELEIVVAYKVTEDIPLSIAIPATEDIPMEIEIPPYKDLPLTINVYDVYGYADVPMEVNVGYKRDIDVPMTIGVGLPGLVNIPLYLTIPEREEIFCECNVYTAESFGHIDDFSTNLPCEIFVSISDDLDVEFSIDVIADTPGSINISSNVAEAVWQEESNLEFYWSQAAGGNFYPVAGYYYGLDNSPATQAHALMLSTIATEADFEIEDSGHYYFHVAARNTIGTFGPTAHYHVQYNHKPTDPTAPMYVNGVDSVFNEIRVGLNQVANLAWTQAIDQDINDVVFYILEIATDDNFAEEEIIYTSSQFNEPNYTLNVIDLNASGQVYWRITALDQHQEANLKSPTGKFKINNPPTIPIGLAVLG